MQALADAVESTIATYCVAEFGEEWDLEGLHTEVSAYWPTGLTVDDLKQCGNTDELYETLMGEATGYYETRENELGSDMMRDIERQVMLNIIDQHWREHLLEMDYLEEGIHLRAMGQKDPLVEWQREGFEMFGAMMHSIAQDFVKYVMHAQISVADQPVQEAAIGNVQYTAPTDPSEAPSTMGAAARAQAQLEGAEAPPEVVEEPVVNTPVVKSEWDKTPRNAPCPCGSGKKFKLCHGRSGG
jgi:preprotein translocase subunit SecA